MLMNWARAPRLRDVTYSFSLTTTSYKKPPQLQAKMIRIKGKARYELEFELIRVCGEPPNPHDHPLIDPIPHKKQNKNLY